MSQFKCERCTKHFKSKWNLEFHLRTHSGEKPHDCQYCDKSFAQVTNLNNHLRMHTGHKPFKCTHCTSTFVQVTSLNNHLRLHTQVRPFQCFLCSKSFTQAGNLDAHLQNHDHDGVQNAHEILDKLLLEKEHLDEQEKNIVTQQESFQNYETHNSNDSTEKMLNFTPVAYWYCCRICKVCIQDENKFITHKITKHPESFIEETIPVVDLISDSEDDNNDEVAKNEEEDSQPNKRIKLEVVSDKSGESCPNNEKCSQTEEYDNYLEDTNFEDKRESIVRNDKEGVDRTSSPQPAPSICELNEESLVISTSCSSEPQEKDSTSRSQVNEVGVVEPTTTASSSSSSASRQPKKKIQIKWKIGRSLRRLRSTPDSLSNLI